MKEQARLLRFGPNGPESKEGAKMPQPLGRMLVEEIDSDDGDNVDGERDGEAGEEKVNMESKYAAPVKSRSPSVTDIAPVAYSQLHPEEMPRTVHFGTALFAPRLDFVLPSSL